MLVDAHVHFWEYDKQRDNWMDTMEILQQDYLPPAISATFERNGIEGCIAIQAAQSEKETAFLVGLAAKHKLIKGVVGWIDLQSNNIEEQLHACTGYPIIRGWRHIVQGEPDDFLWRPAFQRGIQALLTFHYTYDILIFHHQLTAALEFVQQFPDHKLIIDHCAKPGIANGEIIQWKKGMQEIAKAPNVYCKLSGLITEAAWNNWTATQLYPYLDVVFEAFGTNRLVYGSDWPVMLVAGNYAQWKNLLEQYMQGYTKEEQAKIFGINAVRFYNLQNEKLN